MSVPMPIPQPRYCRRSAYELFAQHAAVIDTPAGLIGAAVAMSMHERPDADPHAVDAELQAYADRVKQRVKGESIEARLAHLHDVMFEEEGFRGADRDRYYESANSYLPAVLQTRRGIPISLSLVFADIGQRLGIAVKGVDAPAHFLVRVHSERGEMLIDPYFHGQVMTFADAATRLREIYPAGQGELSVATNRRWIERMLDNLILLFSYEGRDDDREAMQELKGLLGRA